MKKAYWWILVIAAGGVIAYRAYFRGAEKGLETVAVRRGAVAETISETGTVVAVSDLRLFFEGSGRVDEILAKEGDRVEEGDPLMRLRTSDLVIQRQEALAALASAQARYEQALAGATEESILLAETNIRNAGIALAAKERALEDLLVSNEAALAKAYSDYAGSLETLHLKASSAMQALRNHVFDALGNLRGDFTATDSFAVTKAGNDFDDGQEALARMGRDVLALRTASDRAEITEAGSRLLADGKVVRDAASSSNLVLQTSNPLIITQAELDARKAAVNAAWADANAAVNASESLRLAIVSADAANVKAENAAEKEIDAAEASLLSAKQKLEELKAPLRDVDKAIYLTAIASARASLDRIDQRFDDATLRAPASGVIGSIDIELGELAIANAPVGTLISSEHEIESEVSELDIGKIRVGQRAAVAFDALGVREFTGEVAKIAARETVEDGDIFYAVTIVLLEEAALRPGMTADIDILVGAEDGVLLAPRRQVFRRSGKDHVKRVLDDGTVEEVEVSVGLRGRDDYEIKSGVLEGDRLLVE